MGVDREESAGSKRPMPSGAKVRWAIQRPYPWAPGFSISFLEIKGFMLASFSPFSPVSVSATASGNLALPLHSFPHPRSAYCLHRAHIRFKLPTPMLNLSDLPTDIMQWPSLSGELIARVHCHPSYPHVLRPPRLRASPTAALGGYDDKEWKKLWFGVRVQGVTEIPGLGDQGGDRRGKAEEQGSSYLPRRRLMGQNSISRRTRGISGPYASFF